MRALRVLEICSGFAVEGPLGGIERYTMELARALLPHGVEPAVCGMWAYGTPTEGAWQATLTEAGIASFVPAPWDEARPTASFVACWRGSRARLRGQRFDVLHSHCQFGDALAVLLAPTVRARALVRTVHNEREWARRPLRRLLFTDTLAPLLFRRELGVAQQVVDNLDRRPGARLLRKKALVSSAVVNLGRFETPHSTEAVAARRAALGVPADALLIGSVGRLEPQKGYRYLIEAMPEVVERIPRAHLVLAGGGSEAAALAALATASPVAAHIHLAGPQGQIEELYACLDLFASSSLWEGMPAVLMESLASGVPVVATRVSGSVELVRDGETGWLVPPEDSRALARAIIEALSQPERGRATVAAAQPLLARYDIRHAAAEHAALYRRLVG